MSRDTEFEKNLLSEFGIRVKNARKKLGLYQLDVAEAMGVKQSYISAIENGIRHAPFGLAIRLSFFLGFDFIQFYKQQLCLYYEGNEAATAAVFKERNVISKEGYIFPSAGTVELLRSYKQLLDEGILTQEEFNAKKTQVLGL